jgi:GNAT superfamily N-acetyltransferase
MCQLSFSTYRAGDTLILQDLFVAKDFRRNGFANELMSAVENYASRNECSRVEFTTTANNLAAARLYKARGYVQANVVCEAPFEQFLETNGIEPDSIAVLLKKDV